MVGITYGIQPYGHHTMGWTSPKVIAEIGGGLLILALFCFIETRVEQPMFHLDLFKVRAFSAGNLASLLSGIGRGGLQFVLIIWLQGIYLPRHGYSFSDTPLWAGIYLLPLVVGMLFAGPIAGTLSDRIGPRPFAVAGMVLAAASFLLLSILPVNFSYPVFALVIVLNGLGMGIFFSPNRASIMNSLPPNQRGAGGGMAATFMNSAMVLSIGIFFSLMIVGLSGGLHQSLYTGLRSHGISGAVAAKAANLPPVATLFAAFLGYNPVQTLLGPGIKTASPAQQHVLLGHTFFPSIISHPFASALSSAFLFGLAACVIAALASLVPAKGVPFIARRRQTRCARARRPPRGSPGRPLGRIRWRRRGRTGRTALLTYSIVARDPSTGELGVAVQSHWFSVGALVTWARPGVGAIATQANVNVAYGPEGLELLQSGHDAASTVARLIGQDPGADGRQLAIVDRTGAVAAHTGSACMPEAGHATGDAVSCQANIMASARVWPDMLSAYESASGPLADRLIDALEAAERAGGDLRGRQSAALVVVPADGEPWQTVVSLRVEDHPEPLAELRRLLGLQYAYRLADEADELVLHERYEEAAKLYREASERAPGNHELLFWAGLGAAAMGDMDLALAQVREAIALQPTWETMLERLSPDRSPVAQPVLERLRQDAL